jgi:hypothetical protein
LTRRPDIRSLVVLALIATLALLWAPAAHAASSMRDRVVDLEQELDSLATDVEDLGEPVEEFDVFDQCAHLINVSEYGSRRGTVGYVYGATGRKRRPALAMDMRGFGSSKYLFLAFPGEEPPSIECNEDAGGLFTN